MSDFLEALNSALEVKVGDLVKGEVISLQDNKQVIVGIVGAGLEGVVPAKELSAKPVEKLDDVVKVGDVIDLVVVSTISDKENGGSYLLSKRRVDTLKVWHELEEKQAKGEIVEGKVVDVVRGGLVVDLGVRAFVPASLVSDHFVRNLASFKGQTLNFQIIECDPASRQLVLSRKELVAAEKAEKLEAALSNLTVGEVVEGTVARVTNFGAFVNLGGVDGLVHVSELSHNHVSRPEQVVAAGDKVAVKILDIDHETGRISLSIKATQPSPWEQAVETFQAGDVVKGLVKRLTDFGAFVELLPGVEGLVHVSQISHDRVNHPADVLSEGQEVDVKILDLNQEDHRISLSIKALEEAPARHQEEVVEEDNYEDYDVNEGNTTVTLGDILGDQLN